MEVTALIARFFATQGGELCCGELPFSPIAQRFGTPVFVYDSGILQAKYQALRQALPQEFSISYSVKANPSPAILKFFLEKGCGLEIASGGELYQARMVGGFA